jgi:hypothetical protein
MRGYFRYPFCNRRARCAPTNIASPGVISSLQAVFSSFSSGCQMGLLLVGFPPFQSPLYIVGMVLTKGRQMRSISRSSSPRFPQAIPPKQTVPFFSGSFLALSFGTSFPGRRSRWAGSIRVLLERNPPKRPLGPGWRLRLLGERAIPLLKKKELLCHQNTLNRLERTRTLMPPLTCR